MDYVNISDKWKVQLDQEDSDEEDVDIIYTRRKMGRSKVVLHISRMNPINSFINDPQGKWGDDEDFSQATVKSTVHETVTHRHYDEEEAEEDRLLGAGQPDEPLRRLGQTGAGEGRRGRAVFASEESEMVYKEMRIRDWTSEEMAKTNANHKVVQFLIRLYEYVSSHVRQIRKVINPLGWVVEGAEKSYGTGIASFYDMWLWIIYMNMGVCLVMVCFLVIPWLLRTDLSTRDKWGPFFTFDFYLGLLGIRAEEIGKTFFFYGGYAPLIVESSRTYNNTVTTVVGGIANTTQVLVTKTTEAPTAYYFESFLLYGIPYEFRFFYPFSIVVFLALCFFLLVISIGKRLRVVNQMDKQMKFSTAVLSLWDHSVIGKHNVESLKRTIASTFLEYMEYESEKMKETKLTNKTLIGLFFRRLFGWTISILILLGGPCAVFWVTAYYDRLNAHFPFTATVIVTVLSTILPKVLNLMVSFEKYNSAKVTNYNMTIRTYIIKVSLIISLIVRVLFNRGLAREDLEAEGCSPTDAGLIFWQLIIGDFFVSLFGNIFSNFGWLALNRSKKKSELNISDALNKVLYRQTIIWVGSIVCPVLPILGIFFGIILFYARYIVMYYTMGFPKTPIANARGNIFNQFILLATLVLCLVPVIVFFLQPGFECGPAWDHSLWDGMKLWRYYSVDWVKAFFDNILDYIALILTILLILVGIMAYLLYQRFKMFEERYNKLLYRVKEERKVLEGQVKIHHDSKYD